MPTDMHNEGERSAAHLADKPDATPERDNLREVGQTEPQPDRSAHDMQNDRPIE